MPLSILVLLIFSHSSKQFVVLKIFLSLDERKEKNPLARAKKSSGVARPPNPFFFTSAQLQLQELLDNSPKTVKEDSESKKILLERTEERRQRFNINNENFYRLQKNLYKYKRPIDKLQKNKIARQVQYENSEARREKEEEEDRQQQIANKNSWVPYPQLQNGVFDNVDFDSNVSYTKEPDKYNKKDWWYQFQVHCALKAYKYPPFATNYKKNWKPREEGYSIRQKKRDAELFKKYGTKVIRTAE